MIGNCASTVVGVKKNCEAILVIVAAGRQFFKMEVNRFKYFGTIYMKAFKTGITMCDRVMQEQGESWNRRR